MLSAAEMDEAVATFQSIAGCEIDFARSFLEMNGWNLEVSVQAFFAAGGHPETIVGGVGGGGARNGSSPSAEVPPLVPMEDSAVRAPLPQFNDKLIDSDPARRMPQRPPPMAASEHPLEAFRDFRAESGAADASGAVDDASGSSGDVFGLAKKPKNLAEMYRAPTELCFVGTFEQLREAGRQQCRWLLVNIQSPVEFASQQLNADTWQDETLKAVIKASFLFWQQYYDSADGATYCRYYLQNSTSFPHIGVVDPVTGQLVKSWSGFKDAERLMDKLMDYADAPPKDVFADEAHRTHPDGAMSTGPAAGTGAGGAPVGEDDELAAAIAASLSSPAVADGLAAEAPKKLTWPEPPAMPDVGAPDSVLLRVRLPSGQQWQQAFLPEHTLYDVLCAVHHLARHPLNTGKMYQLATQGSPPLTEMSSTLRSHGLSGRVAVNLSERD